MTTKVTIKNHGPSDVMVRIYYKYNDSKIADDRQFSSAAAIPVGVEKEFYVHNNQGLDVQEIKP